jgi:hypothetical protein
LEKQVTETPQHLLIKHWLKHCFDPATEAGSTSSYQCCQPNFCVG